MILNILVIPTYSPTQTLNEGEDEESEEGEKDEGEEETKMRENLNNLEIFNFCNWLKLFYFCNARPPINAFEFILSFL